MKNKMILSLATILCGSVALAAGPSLEDRVSELEAQNSLNIFSFSGAMITRFDSYTSSQDTSISQSDKYGLYAGGALNSVYAGAVDKARFDKRTTELLRQKFQFNVDAKVTPNINFYSRFTMSKKYNSFVRQGASNSPSATDDLSQSNAYNDSKVFVEKAYADVRLPDGNTIFSFGRLPTTDGTPTQFYNAKARMGTYPMLSYNSPLDGFALTYKFDGLFPVDSGNKLAARVVYTPFSNTSAGSALTGAANLTAPTEGSGDSMPTSIPATAVQLDYSNDRMGWTQSFNFIAQYFTMSPLHVNNGADSRGSNTNNTVDPSDLTLGIQNLSLTVEMNGLFGSDFDLVATQYSSTTKTKGTVYAYINGVTVGTSPSASYLPLGGYGCSVSAAGKGCDETFQGNITLVSGRYKFGNTFVGVEWVSGSQNAFFYDSAGDTTSGFYSTPGTAMHYYVTHKFNGNLSLRGGLMTQDYKYSGLGYGQASKDNFDRKVASTYASLRLDF